MRPNSLRNRGCDMEYTYGSMHAEALQNTAGIIEPNGEILSSLPDIPSNATIEYGVQATNLFCRKLNSLIPAFFLFYFFVVVVVFVVAFIYVP